ncbi:hypothetical protein Y032_0007g3295 [Ancylostoma ceylanicum]|uniref:RBR-type E3 ubiquitin transferase n=1 Tax=Ancylostoma ceylanicum TaxID=53326 RepID=A0A016VMG2_9BILA|nr:hypothetical protein Y032_0007g3295 [Ancylostoma ceylanicum]
MSSATKPNEDTVEEDATEMRFPKEFESQNCDALLTSEVFLLLEHRRQQNEAKDEIEDMSEVFIKTLNYARRLSRFKNRETIKAVRAIFSQKPLHKFEVAQIVNLCPETAEEAKVPFGMSSDTREEQLAEVEALKSVYDESRVVIDDGPLVCGRISIEMEPLSKPLTVIANTEQGRHSAELTTLPPVYLIFRLPSEYPVISPELSVECEWMADSLISVIESRLGEVCKENLGMSVLYFCCDTVVEIVQDAVRELSDICLDNVPYGKRHNLTGLELLRRVTDSSQQSEDRQFQSGCYDCEICFENKMGLHCVQFRPCMHVFCKDCVSAFFTEKLNNSEVKALSCPAANCQSIASQNTVRSIIGEEGYERYERILLDRALDQMADVVPCPRKTCQNPVLVSERTLNLGTCQMCGLSFCVLCFRAYHGVDGCNFKTIDKQRILKQWNSADAEERAFMARKFGGLKNLQKIIDNILNEGWLEGNSKPCPRCRVSIEKNEGCNKMQCTKCAATFCWLCNRVLDKNNPYAHFNEEDGGTCANRLFEGITGSDSDDDEEGGINWMDFVRDDDSESDSEVEFVFQNSSDESD